MAPSRHATDRSKRKDKSRNNHSEITTDNHSIMLSSSDTLPDTSHSSANATEATALLQPARPTSTTTGTPSRRPSRVIPYHTDDYTPHAAFSDDIDAREHEEWLERLGASGSSSGTSTPKHSKNAGIRKQTLRGSKAGSLPKPGVLVPVQAIQGESTTRTLAIHHGVDHSWRGYASYYVPFLNWSSKYRFSYLKGDFIAALTMASIYIPMSLSYATSIAGAPAINGIYSYALQPLFYALLGSSSLMVVGPEAAGSLLVGTVVRESLGADHDPDAHSARIVGLVTGLSGAISLVAGLTRLGYLDTILSRPFLRGFISAIGITIVIDQLVPELGLKEASKEAALTNASAWQKLVFVVESAMHGKVHRLTAGVAGGSFVLCFVFKQLKKLLQPHYHAVIYFPDRFLIVVASALLTYQLRWDTAGLEILGPVAGDGPDDPQHSLFEFEWPFSIKYMKEVHSALSTSFIIALLGFFESSVAAKGLEEAASSARNARSQSQAYPPTSSTITHATDDDEEEESDGPHSRPISPTTVDYKETNKEPFENDGPITTSGVSANRELVALGVANVVGGCFMALPAFGGYARSKLNASAGAKSPASGLMLAIISVACMYWVLPYFEYLPTSVLSAMISVVALSMVEEAPHDISFFVRVKGWSELSLMLTIFAATMFYSLYLGIGLGIGLSVLQIIHHASKPRIQILGRVRDSPQQTFENAELHPENVSFVKGCLIIKIPEPLTFANTGALKTRLKRLEFYGSSTAHPSLPRVRRPEHNRNIIFDIHGVTSIDAPGTQVLLEIVQGYVATGTRVFFCRGPDEGTEVWDRFERGGILEAVGEGHLVRGVEEALGMMEAEEGKRRREDV